MSATPSLPARSNAAWVWILATALLVGILLSILVPPMKSPDEGDHVRRAYIFSQGHWLLDSLPCEAGQALCRDGKGMSGGMVDEGLAAYLDILHPMDFFERSQTELERTQVGQFRWAGRSRFVYAPGTGYYLPLMYTPQAAGLMLGKALDLSIDHSYYLARFVTLLSTLLILLLAFRLYAFPPAVLAILVLPMSLFQVASLSIDAVSMA